MEEKAVLANLLAWEQSLEENAKMLKSELEGLNTKIVSKQSEIDYLLAKAAHPKSNKRKCKFPYEENNGESHQGRKRIKLNHERATEPARLAETLLHEEMWREVFSKVDDGLDLLNVSWTFQHFYDILDPLKSNFLFGKIIPFLFLHLNFKYVLKCRLVCRDWSSAINSFLEEWTKINMLRFPSYNYLSHSFSRISFPILWAFSFAISPSTDLINANEFLHVSNSSAKNPFLAYFITLKLKYNEYNELLQHLKGIRTILETFGRHIHHLNCFLEYPDQRAIDLLRDLFSKAVNLQTLVVRDYSHYPNAAQLEFEADSLPSLTTLAYKIEGKHPIANWLFRNVHLQITTLQLSGFEGLVAASEFTWLAVTELRIDSLDVDEEKNYLKYFASFPSLRKLCTFVWCSPLQNILRIIQHLPKICPGFHALELHLCRLEEETLNSAANFLNAPKELDTLELSVSHNHWPPPKAFAFLLCFPFIKRLSIVLGSCHFRHLNLERWSNFYKVEIIELYECLQTNSNPRSSNVWRMLPNLETLQLQNKIYKRPQTLHPKFE